ncbi:GNAT family N-acetyltransferase [Kitasatospora sp. NPDC048540]|uniref:GNAT family N-acetyltransferase n=1 Tax=unclassified Kitasatospora TaxID=2633591 RepID=UPI0011EA6530|nr:GNAT family N-acetyltransferase [Kitasatospora sp. MBT63]
MQGQAAGVRGPEIHRTVAGLPAEAVDGWRELVAADPAGSWFMTPEWVLSWWETLGAGLPAGAAELALWRGDGGRVEAVVPLLRTRERLHPRLPLSAPVFTVLGSGPGAADHCGFPARPERRSEVREFLSARAGRGSLWLPDLDPDQGVLLPPGARRVARAACPRTDLSGGFDAIGSRQFRADLRRYGRKLAAAGVAFRWVPPGQAGPELLDTVLRLHGQRREAMGKATTFDGRRRELHARVLERSAAAGSPQDGPAFLLAERGERVVGALYGFRWGTGFAYYQIGWEPELAPLRLGTAVIAAAVRSCAEQGLATFDFLRGTERYKYRFGAVDRFDESWLVPRGGAGALLGLKHRLKERRAAAV